MSMDLQGWRIEIKKFPRLTEFGAWRGPPGKQYGGFYTQEQVHCMTYRMHPSERQTVVYPARCPECPPWR